MSVFVRRPHAGGGAGVASAPACGVRWQTWVATFICTVVVGGCATAPPSANAPIAAPAANATVPTTPPADAFELKGRISVRVGERLEIATLVWSRARDEERMQFFTPFGAQVADVVRTGATAETSEVMLRRGSETLRAASIAALTESLMGAPLDSDEIARWVQGVGLREDQPVEVTLKNGARWNVTAEKFQTRLRPEQVVTRLIATRDDTVVRVFVDEWQRR